MSKTTKPNYVDTLTYGNTKYVDKNMYMTDNENNEILEDEITRTKKWKKWRKERAKKLKELGAPDILIENELFLSSMTPSEAEVHFKNCEERDKKELNEYMKENPLKEDVVNKLFGAFDELLNAPQVKPMMYSRVRFDMELDPLKYIDRDEYHMGVYDSLIDSFHEEYIKKWKKEIDLEYGYQ